jgi:TorA maturation chaperone TorD
MQTEQVVEKVSTTVSTTAAIDDEIAAQRARAGLFQLAGRCLEEEVDSELLMLLRGDLRLPLAEAGFKLDEDFYSIPETALLETLAVEYTCLFVAPGSVSPYASVFETGTMYREPSDRAVTAYRKAGWDYKRLLSGEFPDHIGTMLSFVGMLANAEADALEQGDHQAAQQWAEQRIQFLLKEIGPWALGWCRRAAAAALQPFYQTMLAFTEQLLWTELAENAERRQLRELTQLNLRDPKKLDYDADFRKASGL